MYWPKEGVETHGVIQVKLVNEDARATYTIRTFSIRHLKVFVYFAFKLETVIYQPDLFHVLVEEEEISERRANRPPIPLYQLARPWHSRTSATYFELCSPVGGS